MIAALYMGCKILNGTGSLAAITSCHPRGLLKLAFFWLLEAFTVRVSDLCNRHGMFLGMDICYLHLTCNQVGRYIITRDFYLLLTFARDI